MSRRTLIPKEESLHIARYIVELLLDFPLHVKRRLTLSAKGLGRGRKLYTDGRP